MTKIKVSNGARESRLDDNYYDKAEDDEEARSIEISIENVHQIDRCHLFECRLNKSSGQWYLAVATPESISLLLYNKFTNKYTLLKCIQTQSDAPCICMKFTNNSTINQLVYACGREFFRMDLLSPSHSVAPITIDAQFNSQNSTPIAVCIISTLSSTTYQPQEAILLCYSTYGIFLVYNFSTQSWQPSCLSSNKKPSASSNNISTSQSDSNLLHASQSVLKWPRGNCLTPLQIEYDSSYLYLFYNDCIVVYQIGFENEVSLNLRKCGITFVYKPRFLSTFSNKTSNCVIISNKRLMDELQLQQTELSLMTESNNKETSEDNNMLTEIDPLIQDLNDKICLSYFSPASN